jgi:hypothetical protein
MIKKVIALVFVSFFVMSGLTVLNENNQNYNISINNINSFTSSSFSPYDFSINKSISYTSGISSSGQTFGCYDNSLYYIYGDSITQFNFKTNKISTFFSFTSQPKQIEIYNNYMIIGYGSGSISLFNIYNFSSNILYTGNFSYDYYFLQFAVINQVNTISILTNGYIYNCKIEFNPFSSSKISDISIDTDVNQIAYSGYNNNLIFAVNGGSGNYPLNQFGFLNVGDSTLNTTTSNSGDYFGNIYDIIDLGNTALLGSQSYYITDKNVAGTTSFSYNAYATGIYFSDSNYNINFIPINITNYAFTKLPVLVNNSNYQEFCYNGKIVSVYLPIGSGNTVFNSATYIINGNSNLIIVNKNNVYVYPLFTYNLNVKSFNLNNIQITNYFLLNGQIYTGYSDNFIISDFPTSLTPLNTTNYFYNGSSITIIQSDFTGSGSNLYYNLSIYYQEIKPASIPLYDIFTYMYPISIIGLFVGMGAFIFIIKKRGYKI